MLASFFLSSTSCSISFLKSSRFRLHASKASLTNSDTPGLVEISSSSSNQVLKEKGNLNANIIKLDSLMLLVLYENEILLATWTEFQQRNWDSKETCEISFSSNQVFEWHNSNNRNGKQKGGKMFVISELNCLPSCSYQRCKVAGKPWSVLPGCFVGRLPSCYTPYISSLLFSTA